MKTTVFDEDLKRIQSSINRVAPDCICQSIERMGGLTNRTYKVTTNQGKAYVVRIPGEGTESMICRNHERVSTSLACGLGIDTPLLFWGGGQKGEEGVKVTEYIADAVTLDKARMKTEDTIRDIAAVLKKLHSCGTDTGIPFEVFEMADTYEKVIRTHEVEMYPDYAEIRKRIMQIKNQVESAETIHVVPCHNDPLPENWVYGRDRLYLIDWEYAGMNDSMWDLADVSIEGEYNKEQDLYFLISYFGREPSQTEKMRFMANKLYVDYLWTLWGKARVPFDGEEMENYALERYKRLKKNLESFEQVSGFH